MPKQKIRFKDRLEYTIFIAFTFLIKISPLFMVKFSRRVLRFSFGKISKKYPGILAKNLKIAFPHHTAEENSRLMEAISRHFSSIFIELVYIFTKKKSDKILKPVKIIHLDYLKKALEKKKGVILFSGHFGNWELVPYILHQELDRKINSVARRMNNPLVEKKVREFRTFMGSHLIDKKNSIRTILKCLEKNEILFILIDQNTIEREAVFVDFFGKKASVVSSVSQLHLRRKAPIIPVFLHYEADKIVLEFLEEIEHPDSDSDNRINDVTFLTQKCTALIEEKIRQYPEQWFWFHNRWKTRPPDEKNDSKRGGNHED